MKKTCRLSLQTKKHDAMLWLWSVSRLTNEVAYIETLV
jgi:hypothetical protein